MLQDEQVGAGRKLLTSVVKLEGISVHQLSAARPTPNLPPTGYLDAGHGHQQDFQEVNLKNEADTWLNSKDALMATDANGNNGVAAAGGAPGGSCRCLSLGGLRCWREEVYIFRAGVRDFFAAFRAAFSYVFRSFVCALLLLASLFLPQSCFSSLLLHPLFSLIFLQANTSYHGFCRGKAAAEAAPFPAATDDWSSVSLYGKAGTNTWPIASWSIGSWPKGDIPAKCFPVIGSKSKTRSVCVRDCV